MAFEKRTTVDRQVGSRIKGGVPSEWAPIPDEEITDELNYDQQLALADAIAINQTMTVVTGDVKASRGLRKVEYRYADGADDDDQDQDYDEDPGHD